MPRLSLGLGVQTIRKVGGGSAIPQSGLSLWLKADAGVTQLSYVSQIVLTCTGGLSSYSGTYIATSVPDIDGVYSLFSSANSKTIFKEGFTSNFTIGPDFPMASSGDGISWSLANVLVTGLTISGSDDADANGAYGLNERDQSTANLINDNGYNLNTDTSGVCEIYTPDNATLLYSNSSNGSGTWTNEGGTGDVTASSIQLDPSGTVSGSITTTLTSSVTGWADQSGNGKNATTLNNSPTITTINSKPFVRFNGVDQALSGSNVISTIPCTIISVVRWRSFKGIDMWFEQYGGEDNIALYAGNTFGWRVFNGENLDSTDSEWGFDVTQLATTIVDGENSAFFHNGTAAGTGDSGGRTPAGNYYLSYFAGSEEDSYRHFDIAEIIVYNRAITTQERQQVEAYLNAKYAIY